MRPAVAAGTQQAVRGQNVPVHDMCGVHYFLRDCAIHEALSCPLLALSGHPELHCTCPLSGVKRTCRFALHMSAYDPKRTCARLAYRHARRGFRNRAGQKLGDATIAPVVHVEFVLRQESAEREAFRQAPIAH